MYSSWSFAFTRMWVAYAHGQQLGQVAAKQQLIKINDDLYVIHNDFVPGNTTALITDEGVVLVDDKFAVDHDSILAELKKVTSKPIRYVINTHHHADHSGGNVKMQQMNVKVVSSEQARENIAGSPRDGLFIDTQPGFPNVTFENHMQIHLGGRRLELYYFGRAHTSGDIVVYFPAARTLASGDIFVFGDATPQLIDYAGGGSAKEWTTARPAPTRSLSQIGRRRRQSLRFYRDRPNLSFFSRQSLRKSLPASTFKEIEVRSTGALHCDRRRRIEL